MNFIERLIALCALVVLTIGLLKLLDNNGNAGFLYAELQTSKHTTELLSEQNRVIKSVTSDTMAMLQEERETTESLRREIDILSQQVEYYKGKSGGEADLFNFIIGG